MSIPQPPSTDINDPQVLAGAKRVATRRNNDAQRKIDKERADLPLLADQLPVAPAHLVTPDEVIERRQLYQIASWENGVERDLRQRELITRDKNLLFAMVGQTEYTEIFARSLEANMPEWAFWSLAIDAVRRRAEPMPPDAELVLIWLVDWEGEPPTTRELERKRGDGMTWRQIFEALRWLEDRDYVRGGRIRSCPFTEGGSSAPFSATDAGRAYCAQGGAR